MLAALILAAGESKRMGTPKALLQHEGHTFLERLLDAARHPKIGITRVVLGCHSERVLAKVQLEPATVVLNPEWKKGQLSSIQAVLKALPSGDTEGVILFLVDGKQGLVAAATSPQEFDAFMRTEMGNFERVIKTLKLKMN